MINTLVFGVAGPTSIRMTGITLDSYFKVFRTKSGISGDNKVGVMAENVPFVELFAIHNFDATATLPISLAIIFDCALSSDCDDEIVMPPKVRMVRIKPAIVQSSCGDMVLS